VEDGLRVFLRYWEAAWCTLWGLSRVREEKAQDRFFSTCSQLPCRLIRLAHLVFRTSLLHREAVTLLARVRNEPSLFFSLEACFLRTFRHFRLFSTASNAAPEQERLSTVSSSVLRRNIPFLLKLNSLGQLERVAVVDRDRRETTVSLPGVSTALTTPSSGLSRQNREGGNGKERGRG
jgi:hypothetical protein